MSDIFDGKSDEHIIHFKETLLYMLGLAEAELMKRRAREATRWAK
jgi:hypothetical protein